MSQENNGLQRRIARLIARGDTATADKLSSEMARRAKLRRELAAARRRRS